MIKFLLVCVAISLTFAKLANAQYVMCINNEHAYSAQVQCDCTGRLVWGGGCQSNGGTGRSGCAIMSFYKCGTSGAQTCQVAYTETISGVCPSSAQPLNRTSALPSLSVFRSNSIRALLQAEATSAPDRCAAARVAFNRWLTEEMRASSTRSAEVSR
jgi:hypothetical protein